VTIISLALGRESEAASVYSNRQGGVNVILCDLCGNQKDCFQKEIDGREFDICADCWWPLGREAERQRAVEKEAGDGFSASTDHARAGGAKDAACRRRLLAK
jgi:ribosome-binding protein aMBF1 (putative translation factor)